MISSVILTKNEEENIEECIKSLNWCDEVIVIDNYSEDKTREVAKK
ncbi:MAG TPA: glycosyltransferase, partial [Patescibacteria group bacterium]|nr:glycosyltransferase [Patescibacteria group bacterium]